MYDVIKIYYTRTQDRRKNRGWLGSITREIKVIFEFGISPKKQAYKKSFSKLYIESKAEKEAYEKSKVKMVKDGKAI